MNSKILFIPMVLSCMTAFAESQREVVKAFLNDVYALNAEHCAAMTTYDMAIEANGRFECLTNWVERIVEWKVGMADPKERPLVRKTLNIQKRNLDNQVEALFCSLNKTAEGSASIYAGGYLAVGVIEDWLWAQLGIRKDGAKTIAQQLREIEQGRALKAMSDFVNGSDWHKVSFSEENMFLPIDNHPAIRGPRFSLGTASGMHSFKVTNGVLCAKIEHAIRLKDWTKKIAEAMKDITDNASAYKVKIVRSAERNQGSDVLEYPVPEALFRKFVDMYEQRVESRPPMLQLDAGRFPDEGELSGRPNKPISGFAAACPSSEVAKLYPVKITGTVFQIEGECDANGKRVEPLLLDCVFRFSEKENFSITPPGIRWVDKKE